MNKFTLANVICASAVATTTLVPTISIGVTQAINDNFIKSILNDVVDEFFDLCDVPRRTFYTRQICDYLKSRFVKYGVPFENIHEDNYRSNWAAGHEHIPDELSSGNLWIDVPATDDKLKNATPFALQAHMDMVWTKTDDYSLNNPTPVMEETERGRVIHTLNHQSSLGADDGAGLALMLAIAKNKNYKHGPLRFIITADEEEGMFGAKYVGCNERPNGNNEPNDRVNVFQGIKYLLNIDGEKEGEITTSTAGAVISEFNLTYPREEVSKDVGHLYTIQVDGLQGGHSGMDIHKNRLNALKVLCEVLKKVESKYKFKIIGIHSYPETGVNVIPSNAYTLIKLESNPPEEWGQEIKRLAEEVYAEQHYKEVEPSVNVLGLGYSVKSEDNFTCYNFDETSAIISLLNTLSYGVYSWIDEENKIVETSANIGPLICGWKRDQAKDHWQKNDCSLKVEARSCNNEHIIEIVKEYQEIYHNTIYPLPKDSVPEYMLNTLYWGWPGDEDKSLFKAICKAYKSIGVDWTKIDAHAGLEISWFQQIEPSLLMSAIGPTIENVHDEQETFYVDTYRSVINAVVRAIHSLQK